MQVHTINTPQKRDYSYRACPPFHFESVVELLNVLCCLGYGRFQASANWGRWRLPDSDEKNKMGDLFARSTQLLYLELSDLIVNCLVVCINWESAVAEATNTSNGCADFTNMDHQFALISFRTRNLGQANVLLNLVLNTTKTRTSLHKYQYINKHHEHQLNTYRLSVTTHHLLFLRCIAVHSWLAWIALLPFLRWCSPAVSSMFVHGTLRGYTHRLAVLHSLYCILSCCSMPFDCSARHGWDFSHLALIRLKEGVSE